MKISISTTNHNYAALSVVRTSVASQLLPGFGGKRAQVSLANGGAVI